MKHITTISAPAKAALPEDHPTLWNSLSAFVKDPVGTLAIHFDKDAVA